MFNALKKLFGESKPEKKAVVAETPKQEEPPFQEIQFDPDKHIIDPLQLKEYFVNKKQVQVIDVREPYEWKMGRLAGVKHIPMNFLPMELDKLDKNLETITICEHGMRSMDVAFFLVQNGFADVKSLDGGMARWYANNGNALIEKG